jgi:hypothetical protein
MRSLLRPAAGLVLAAAVGCGGGGAKGLLPADLLTPNSVDFTVDPQRVLESVRFVVRNFQPGDCALVEGLIAEPGVRRLLVFDTLVVNMGAEHVVIGNPVSPVPPLVPEDFEYSPCHDHYHFRDWAEYSIVNEADELVALGRKQSFCLRDNFPRVQGAITQGFTCQHQGLSSGWVDLYDRALDGQWVDVTGVPSGAYTLVVTVNAGGLLPEADDRWPNTARVPVQIP